MPPHNSNYCGTGGALLPGRPLQMEFLCGGTGLKIVREECLARQILEPIRIFIINSFILQYNPASHPELSYNFDQSSHLSSCKNIQKI